MHEMQIFFYNFDRKICKILVINYCCEALLNILQKRRNTNNKCYCYCYCYMKQA